LLENYIVEFSHAAKVFAMGRNAQNTCNGKNCTGLPQATAQIHRFVF
jgi:hypothetical protein